MISAAAVQLITAAAGSNLEEVSLSSTADNAATDLPKCKVTATGGAREQNDDGAHGVIMARYTLDLYGVTALDLENTLKTIRNSLEAASGAVSGVSGVSIVRIWFPEPPTLSSTGVSAKGSSEIVARLSQDCLIFYRET